MTDQSLAVRANGAIAQADQWSGERIELIKRTIAKGATNDELALFIQVCKRTGLDPFARQLYWIKRGNQASIQFGIDGLRLMAERTGQYGGSETHWCGPDGDWVDVWTDLENPPFAARTSVWKVGVPRPFTAVCRYASYKQDTKFWRESPDNQLAKCSEGLALRKAFPADLAGYRQAAPEIDRGGDRIIDRTTGEITDDDAYDRVSAEYEATRRRTQIPAHVTSTTDPHRAPDLMEGAVTGATPIEPGDEIEALKDETLLEACKAILVEMERVGLTPLPKPERRNNQTLRVWLRINRDVLDEHMQAGNSPPPNTEADWGELGPADAADESLEQPPLIETPAPTTYDEAQRGRGARGR
jgi:phage recombination protein Bet